MTEREPDPAKDGFDLFRAYWLQRCAEQGDRVFIYRVSLLAHEQAVVDDPSPRAGWRKVVEDRTSLLYEWRTTEIRRQERADVMRPYAQAYRARYWYWRIVSFLEPKPDRPWRRVNLYLFTVLSKLWARLLSKATRDVLSGNGPGGRDLGQFYGKYTLDRVGRWRLWREMNGEKYAPARRAWKLKPSKMRFRSWP